MNQRASRDRQETGYPKREVTAAIRSALSEAKRGSRRTPVEAAAERLVDAIAVLMQVADESDRVAFEDARAAVEKYRDRD